MGFSDKLSTLVNVYRMSNAMLARGIGVDPSLVSRWKNGDRAPAAASGTVRQIAAFLAGSELRDFDRELLLKTLGPYGHNVPLTDAIDNYLNETAPQRQENGTTRAHAELLLTDLGELLHRDDPMGIRGPISLWPRVQKGQPSEHETFQGRAGKRQGTINFLHAVLSYGKPLPVRMMSLEDALWITEDAQFETMYIKALYAMTKQGCDVALIHSRPKDKQSLLSLLGRYLPLYQTGRLRSYFAGDERLTQTLPTLFVARGQAALISFGQDPRQDADITALYQNHVDAAMYETMFQVYLSSARPLAYSCATGGSLSYCQALLGLETTSMGAICEVSMGEALWLSEAALSALTMSHMPSPEVAEAAVRLISRRREKLASASEPWVMLWPEESLRILEEEGRMDQVGTEIFGPEGISLSGEVLRDYLKRLIHDLRAYDHLTLALSTTLPQGMRVACKQNVGALVGPGVEGHPRAIFLGDEDSLALLSDWCRDHESASENKETVIARLDRALEKLDNYVFSRW